MNRGNHTLATSIGITIGEADVVEWNATVTYHRHDASGDGWNEPREAAYCEVVGITFDLPDRRRLPLPDLIVDQLTDALQPELMQAWADDREAAIEARADTRRDDAMLERLS